jgi:hypothetical protein
MRDSSQEVTKTHLPAKKYTKKKKKELNIGNGRGKRIYEGSRSRNGFSGSKRGKNIR